MKRLERNSESWIQQGKLMWKILYKLGLLSQEDINALVCAGIL